MTDLAALILNPDTTVNNEAAELDAAARQLARHATDRDDATELLKMLGIMPETGYSAHVHSRYQYRRTPQCAECRAESAAYNREHPPKTKRLPGECSKGHQIVGDNVMHRTNGGTRCKQCHHDYCKAYGRKKRSEACCNGHTWTPETTFVAKNGTRQCITCSNERYRNRKGEGS